MAFIRFKFRASSSVPGFRVQRHATRLKRGEEVASSSDSYLYPCKGVPLREVPLIYA